MGSSRSNAALVIFLALVLISSAALTLFALKSGFGGSLSLLMWSVGLSAMLALKLTGVQLTELGWGWGRTKYHLIALSLPILYCSVAYGGAALLGLAGFASPERTDVLVREAHTSFVGAPLSFALALAIIACAGMLQTMTSALGEEIGWRGFLLPRLVSLWGFLAGTLVSGAIWAAWHMPLILLGIYNAGGDVRFELASFALMVVSMSAAISWLRLRSESLWPCVTFHATHNLVVQGIFDPLVVRGPGHITMVGEFGVVMALVVALLSLPFWILGVRMTPARPQ